MFIYKGETQGKIESGRGPTGPVFCPDRKNNSI